MQNTALFWEAGMYRSPITIRTFQIRVQGRAQERKNLLPGARIVYHSPFDVWTAHRTKLLQCTHTHRGNTSFFLGEKSPSDDQNWTPNLEAVRASIRFAIATGQLDAAQPCRRTQITHSSRSNSHQPPRARDGIRASTAKNWMFNS